MNHPKGITGFEKGIAVPFGNTNLLTFILKVKADTIVIHRFQNQVVEQLFCLRSFEYSRCFSALNVHSVLHVVASDGAMILGDQLKMMHVFARVGSDEAKAGRHDW